MKRTILILRFIAIVIIAFVAAFYAVGSVADYKFGIMVGTYLGGSLYEMVVNLLNEEENTLKVTENK